MRVCDELNLAFIYMGVLMGAGFASGREIMSFFTIHGEKGLAGIILACALFFVTGYTVFRASILRRSDSLRQILLPYAGEGLMSCFEIVTLAFLLVGYYIMITGCTAVLRDFANLPVLSAGAALCLICVIWLHLGPEGLADFNLVLVPLMTLMTLLICCLSLTGPRLPPGRTAMGTGNWFVSSLLYVSFNTSYTSAVIASLGNFTTKVKAAFGASLIASAGLFVTASTLWYVTFINYEALTKVEVPLLFIALRLGHGFYIGAVGVLLSAMMTTAIGFGYAFARGIKSRFNISYSAALTALFAGFPATTFGFSRMIDILYPLFGALGILFLIILMIRRFFHSKIE